MIPTAYRKDLDIPPRAPALAPLKEASMAQNCQKIREAKVFDILSERGVLKRGEKLYRVVARVEVQVEPRFTPSGIT